MNTVRGERYMAIHLHTFPFVSLRYVCLPKLYMSKG
ncbi:unnamed protein product [Brassica rapa]|uniref:Uncharacterized protein n=1 Tax=Brassica campestris TaxID=3711 RepID=A0A8D9HJ90_BRACM|nr:unnamed protein product [Brassica rapa]